MEEAPIVFLFVGRGTDVFASAYGDYARVSNCKEAALQMLGKVTNRPGKFSFQIDEARAAYALVAGGLCYGSIVNSKLVSAAGALSVLAKVRDAFEASFSKAERDFAPEGSTAFQGFSREIDRLIRDFGGGDLANVGRVKAQVEGAKQAMAMNIDAVLERGERLDHVVQKSNDMQASALTFNKASRKMRRKFWWKNVKLQLFILFLVLLLVFVIFLAACRGFACVT